MHCRQQIRDAVIAQLKTDLPNYTVLNTRALAIEQNQIPALSVYTEDETIAKSNLSGIVERTLVLRVEIYRSGSRVYDLLDSDMEKVEPSVLTALGTLELMDEPVLDRVEISISDESNARLGAARCEYTVRYRTDPSNPSLFVE